jgi:hypothetical protein
MLWVAGTKKNQIYLLVHVCLYYYFNHNKHAPNFNHKGIKNKQQQLLAYVLLIFFLMKVG